MKAALALVALVAAVATASAAASLPRLILVVPASVHRGHSVTVSGKAGDCPVGDSVTLISRAFVHTHDFAGLPAVFAKVRTRHSFRVSTRIPRTKRPGVYAVTARCGGGNLGVRASVHVLR